MRARNTNAPAIAVSIILLTASNVWAMYAIRRKSSRQATELVRYLQQLAQGRKKILERAVDSTTQPTKLSDMIYLREHSWVAGALGTVMVSGRNGPDQIEVTVISRFATFRNLFVRQFKESGLHYSVLETHANTVTIMFDVPADHDTLARLDERLEAAGLPVLQIRADHTSP